LVTAGEDLKVWETGSYAQIYQYAPETEGARKADLVCGSWSADTTGIASLIKNEDKILLTFNKGGKYTSHEIITQGISKPSFLQFPRTSQKHLYLSAGSELHYFDVARQKSRKSFTLKSQISCFTPNQTDSHLAVGCNNGSIVLLTTASNQLSNPMTGPKCAGQRVTSLKYSLKRPAFLGSSSESGTVSFWDCNASKNIFNINEHLAPCTSFAFSPVNDTLAASCGLDKKFICHDTKSRRSVCNLVLEQPCTTVDFDVDGTTVAVGTSRGKVFIYDLRNTSTAWRTLTAHNGKVATLAFKPIIDKGNVTQVMSAVKSKLRTQKSITALKTVEEEFKENVKPEDFVFNENKGSFDKDEGASDTSVFSKRDSLSSQLFSPLKETEFSFTQANPPSGSSSRRTSEVRLSTEGLFSPVREEGGSLNLGRRTPLSNLGTPAASPALTSIQEESTSPPNLKPHSFSGKLSLETLTEVAKSVTFRAEGSPEYDESAVQHRQQPPPPDMPEPVLDLYQQTKTLRPVPETENRMPGFSSVTADPPRLRSSRRIEGSRNSDPSSLADSEGRADLQQAERSLPEERMSGGFEGKSRGESDQRERRSRGDSTGQDLKSILTAFPTVLLEDISPEQNRRTAGNITSNILNRPPTLRMSRQQDSAGESSGSTSGGGGQADGFNRRYVEEVVTEAMEEWCSGVEDKIINMHYSLIRIMHQCQDETKSYIEELHGMEELKRENERLRLENQQLKQFF